MLLRILCRLSSGNTSVSARPARSRPFDLGADWHARKNDRDRKARRHLKELQALGYHVTITEAA